MSHMEKQQRKRKPMKKKRKTLERSKTESLKTFAETYNRM